MIHHGDTEDTEKTKAEAEPKLMFLVFSVSSVSPW